MRNVGRMRTLSVSGRVLLLAGIFFVILIALAVFSISQYLKLYTENGELRQELTSANASLKRLRAQTQILAQYDKLADQLNQSEPQADDPLLQPGSQTDEPASSPDQPTTPVSKPEPAQPAAPDQTVKTPPTEEPTQPVEPVVTEEEAVQPREEPDTSEEAVQPDEPEPDPPVQQPVENPPVDAVKLTLLPEGKQLVRFQYNLSNIHPENKAVSGYLFIVLANTSTNPPTLASYPEVEIENGNPVDYKKGTQFSIRIGKTVRGRVRVKSSAKDYTEAWVFTYAEDGTLLMKKHLSSGNG